MPGSTDLHLKKKQVLLLEQVSYQRSWQLILIIFRDYHWDGQHQREVFSYTFYHAHFMSNSLDKYTCQTGSWFPIPYGIDEESWASDSVESGTDDLKSDDFITIDSDDDSDYDWDTDID